MRRACCIAALVVTGCGDAESPPPPSVQVASCAPLELALPDGSCMRPGILPDGCAEGFVHDGEYGCEPVLPVDPCPPALMAVPGDPECRPIMPCGSGKWGDIPVDATTQYVDASYTGNQSDGSADHPWISVQDAFTAVASGGIIAVAEGSYDGLAMVGKPVRIMGVCPERVELLGGVVIFEDGSELSGLALRGGVPAVSISGAENVLLDRLWVHAAASRGLEAHALSGSVSARVTGSLFEDNVDIALVLGGVTIHVDTSVIRRTLPNPADDSRGLGIQTQDCGIVDGCESWLRTALTLERSLVDENHQVGMYILGTDLTMDGTVVRGTLPQAATQSAGRGVSIEMTCDETQCHPEASSRATLRGVLVERNYDAGLTVIGSEAIIENTIVRDTLPRNDTQDFGRGLAAEFACSSSACDGSMPATLELRRGLIERNFEAALLVMGSQAVIEDTVVRHTSPRQYDGQFGRGVAIQLACTVPPDCFPEAGATAELRRMLIDDNHDVGLFAVGSTATVETTVVRRARARLDGKYGDGIAVSSEFGVGSLTATLVHVEDSARAGISNFGGFASIGASAVQCSAFDVEGEYFMRTFTFEDRGGNRCGCPVPDAECIAVSPGLEPPGAITD